MYLGLIRHWKLAATLALLVGAFFTGVEWRDRAADLEREEMLNAIHEARATADRAEREREEWMQRSASIAEQNHQLRREAQLVETKTLTREVIRYVQTPAATDCGPDPEWVRIHDNAADPTRRMRETANPAPGIDVAAFEVTNADTLTTVTENYSNCHSIRNQLISLQEWVSAVHERAQQ